MTVTKLYVYGLLVFAILMSISRAIDAQRAYDITTQPSQVLESAKSAVASMTNIADQVEEMQQPDDSSTIINVSN